MADAGGPLFGSDAADELDEDPFALELEGRLREAVRVDPMQIEKELARTPTQIAFWSEKLADAIGKRERAELAEKRLRALVRIEIDEDAKALGNRLTVADLDARVEDDERVKKLVDERIEAKVEEQRAKGRLTAVVSRKDVTVAIAANMRAEMMRDPNFRSDVRDFREKDRGGRG